MLTHKLRFFYKGPIENFSVEKCTGYKESNMYINLENYESLSPISWFGDMKSFKFGMLVMNSGILYCMKEEEYEKLLSVISPMD